MPVSPSAVMRHVIDLPICATPATRIGSMFGSIGSMYGGMKMREPAAPCWWMSLTICGWYCEYSESTTICVSTCVNAYQSRLLS
jgi:hypothetical protein